MKERTNVFKSFERKKVRLITNSGFTYHTDCLELVANGVVFKDRLGSQKFISFDEIKFVEESDSNFSKKPPRPDYSSGLYSHKNKNGEENDH